MSAHSNTELIERERQFYNESHGRYRQIRQIIWRAIGAFNRNEELTELYDPRGKRVLLYGCGPANEAQRLLDRGASSLAGIDISDGEIAQAWESARAGGYEDLVDFRAGDAHQTGFADASFDLIVGSAILHHLELDRALGELRRVLAPGGRAVFLEPLARNPILRLGRFLTPAARTPDEHPFTVDDWQLCARHFPAFWHREVELTSIPLMPLNLVVPQNWQERLAVSVNALDDRLLERYPRLRPYARSTMIVLE
ncbi:MAG TPA: class I SAM-dependent methyltransferase [Solirubrobacteraceae bacterium]|nr:class I SAM-dependent methyltransferase [Solirubrobacteraceae bacterium]